MRMFELKAIIKVTEYFARNLKNGYTLPLKYKNYRIVAEKENNKLDIYFIKNMN